MALSFADHLRMIRASSALIPDTYVTAYANYSTGLAAVSNGQYFAAPIDTYRAGVWLKTAGVGVLTGVQPVDTGLALVRPGVEATGALPGSPIVDVDAIDGLWSLSEIKNRASGAPAASLNLLWSTNGARTHYLNGGLTDTLAQTDSQGGTAAVKLDHASGATAATYAQFIVPVPPGQWTFQFDARTADASTQTWKIGTNSTTGLSDITITGTKQTFSASFTITTTTTRYLLVCQGSYPSAAAAAGSIVVENFRLIPGGSAQVGVQDQSQRVGFYLRGNSTTYSGAVMTGALGNTLAIKPAGTIAATSYTLMICGNISRPASTSAMLYGASSTLSQITYAGSAFTTNNSQTVDGLAYNNGSGVSGGLKPANSGMQVHAFVVTPSAISHYIDGQLLNTVAATSAIATSYYLALLGGISTAIAAKWATEGSFSGVAFWTSALDAATVASATTKMLARLTAKSQSKQAVVAAHFAEGDSITAGSGDSGASMGGYATRAHGLTTAPRVPYVNKAVFGATLRGADGSNSLQGRFNSDSAIITSMVAKGWTPIVTVLIGTNDANSINTQSAAETYFTDLNAYVASVRALGAKVILGTFVPCDTGASAHAYDRTSITISGGAFNGQTFNGLRNYLRAMVLAAPSNYDGIADYGGDAAFTSYSATYFGDVAHPNALGHSVMAGILAPVLQAVINSL